MNVQAIVDKKKRILFRDISSRGAEHDSTAWKNTPLYKWCIDNWRTLAREGLYFIGDSAYSIMSFLITPFDNTYHQTGEDNFNFFHSSSRISVECTFGEVDLRWGILWRTLGFSLEHNTKIIDACMRLHNFIVDFREEHSDVGPDREIFDEDCRRFMAVNPDLDFDGVVGGDDEEKRDSDGNKLVGGRPTNLEVECRKYGKSLRAIKLGSRSTR